MNPQDNKFHKGAPDGKHYWLTPPDLAEQLQEEFAFDFDACPYPKPLGYDSLVEEWGNSTYVNPPFGSFIAADGKKKGPTAWARKAIEESKKGKRVVMVFPIDKWVLMLLDAGAKVRNLRDVKWCAIEDGSPGKGMGRHIACFILGGSGRKYCSKHALDHPDSCDECAEVAVYRRNQTIAGNSPMEVE